MKVTQNSKILGYNKEIKDTINQRRKACENWKTEKDKNRKAVLKRKYEELKEKVQDLIDRTEGEEIKNMIDKRGKERIDFWKLMRKLKKKDQGTERLENEEKIITTNEEEILEIKRKYFEKLYAKPQLDQEQEETDRKYEKELKEDMNDLAANTEEYNTDFVIKELEDVIDKSKKKSQPGPDIITYEMIQKGKNIIGTDLLSACNRFKNEEEDKPKEWNLADIVSIYKGKGRKESMNFQRGLSLTNCPLKCLEMMIGKRIDPIIKENSTPLQGGGKSGEDVEEYLLAIQTVVDVNIRKNKYTSLIITDVAKAFDQAWRIGVFRNLSKRGIKGKILKLTWKLNNEMKAQIKKGDKRSDELTVEESIRQGSALSAILYAQHAAVMIEDLQIEKLGAKINEIQVPAIGWQDDITMIPQNEEEAEAMTHTIHRSSKTNRIKFSDGEDKCKILRMGKPPENLKRLSIGEINLPEKLEAKVLGHHFCKANNNSAHIREKEKSSREMLASMGTSINNAHMGRMYIQTMITLYRMCFLRKLLFGLTGFKLLVKEMEKLEAINRSILRNFLQVPKTTPVAAIYLEMGILPIQYEIKKKKLNMWHRINRIESNQLISNIKYTQVMEDLPWMKQLVEIAIEIDINLTEAKKDTKEKWKEKVKKKILNKAKESLEEERNKTERYQFNSTDAVKINEQKSYLQLPTKLVRAFFRGRAGILDPEPTKPYWRNIWRCKLCKTRDQSTNHYITSCEGTKHVFHNQEERIKTWSNIQTLQPEGQLKRTGTILNIIYQIIQRANN